MKRRVLLAAVCLCASLSPVALAEIDVNTIDLSGLSSAELLILQNKLNAAMWESADWKQVTIQPGILKVGVDIPAGHYTITAADADVIKFRYGNTLNSGKTAVTYSSNAYLSENLVSPSAKNYHSNSVTSIDVDMQAGCYVDISLGCAVFSPYTGAAFAFSEEALTMPPASTPTPKPTRRPTPVPTATPKATKKPTPSPSPSPMPKLSSKVKYGAFDYKAVARNPEKFVDKTVRITGKVLQVMGSRQDGYDLRIATDGNYGDVVYVYVPADNTPDFNILEDDQLTIRAVLKGDYTYKTVLGSSVTLPLAYADSVRLDP